VVISHFSFVGFDRALLSLIMCGLLAVAAIGIWFWNQKPPLSILFGMLGLAILAIIRPPDFVVNLVVVLAMAFGAWLEGKYLRTSRGFLWVFAFAVWTVGSLVYDFKTPHWVRLRDDNLIEQTGDRRTILLRKRVRVVHATRKVSQLDMLLDFWSIEDGEQAIPLFNDQLYSDLDGRMFTGGGVAREVAKWAHVTPVEKELPPEQIDFQPWTKS
jgi:hypothetical protein